MNWSLIAKTLRATYPVAKPGAFTHRSPSLHARRCQWRETVYAFADLLIGSPHTRLEFLTQCGLKESTHA